MFSAICVIFIHGANEVSYTAGPLTTIWTAYVVGQLPKQVVPPIWVVIIGAVAMATGILTYGYNGTRAVGNMFAKITPARGFACELATAMVTMLATQ